MEDNNAECFHDVEILEKLRGEKLADNFHLLVEKYMKVIFAVAYRMLGNPEDAEDVTIDTFVYAFQSLPEMLDTGQDIHLRPWLLTIVRNRCFNHRRDQERLKRPPSGIPLDRQDIREHVEGTPYGQLPSAEYEAVVRENNNKLYKALRQLSERERVIIILHYIGELPDSEIASILKGKPDTIKKARQRAVIKLRKIMDKDKQQ
jgi:RNA polymerase sigma-70 factor (ECF subfamily)